MTQNNSIYKYDKDVEKRILEVLKKDNPVLGLTEICQELDPVESTMTYIWIRIWEVASKKGWLIPFLNEFKKPAIPKINIVDCAMEVKRLIPETPFDKIVKNILMFVS